MTNLTPLFRGDSRDYSLTFTDDNGDAINITGWKVYFTLKKNEWDKDSKAVVKKDTTEHEAPGEGHTIISLEPSDTDALEAGDYHYDFQVKKPQGDILTVAQGILKILTDITRRTS